MQLAKRTEKHPWKSIIQVNSLQSKKIVWIFRKNNCFTFAGYLPNFGTLYFPSLTRGSLEGNPEKWRKARAEPSITTATCCHRRPRSNYALRAGRVLTAGGSRAQISIAEATRNGPPTTSREGSRAAAIDLCKADERRLHQRRWYASCIDRRKTTSQKKRGSAPECTRVGYNQRANARRCLLQVQRRRSDTWPRDRCRCHVSRW